MKIITNHSAGTQPISYYKYINNDTIGNRLLYQYFKSDVSRGENYTNGDTVKCRSRKVPDYLYDMH